MNRSSLSGMEEAAPLILGDTTSSSEMSKTAQLALAATTISSVLLTTSFAILALLISRHDSLQAHPKLLTPVSRHHPPSP
ncbi:hypothetical protein E2C01_044625 [Portunus trituberculatus]|uniref:Uncharacterized protein n=1 Tax=Portunus trituberculatus TaxID=210409 RepID=A0A5B7FW45_PORTR|nr:hypothetical protein [Portunus trituberculatus]